MQSKGSVDQGRPSPVTGRIGRILFQNYDEILADIKLGRPRHQQRRRQTAQARLVRPFEVKSVPAA